MKVFVIHPDRLKERGEHVDRMLRGMGIDYEFVNEGNSESQIQAYLDLYMQDGAEEMHKTSPSGSVYYLAFPCLRANN